MGWLDDMTIAHEITQHLPEVRDRGELCTGERQRPLVPVAFSVAMEVRHRNLFPVWVAVWCTAEAQPHQHNHVSGTRLVGALTHVQAPPAHVEQKMLVAIVRDQGNAERTTRRRILPDPI